MLPSVSSAEFWPHEGWPTDQEQTDSSPFLPRWLDVKLGSAAAVSKPRSCPQETYFKKTVGVNFTWCYKTDKNSDRLQQTTACMIFPVLLFTEISTMPAECPKSQLTKIT